MNDDFTFVGTRPARPNPPKQAYDMEYSTQARREFEYLKEHNINPSFVKQSQYGIKTYKYTKTPALFRLLVDYFTMIEAEKELNKLESATEKTGIKIDPDKQEQLIDALIAAGAPIKKVRIYA
jgi:hypothetical protein